MKTKFPLFLLIFFLLKEGYSQTFTLTCDTLVRYGSPGSFFVFYPQLTNLSGQDLQIRIARRQNLLPTPNWSSSICYGYCYPSEVDSVEDVMPYPFTGIDFTLDILSDPAVQGTALVTLAVVNKMNPNDFQQLTFTASTLPISVKYQTENLPDRLALYNYPNPFNPATTIFFEIPAALAGQKTELAVYNVLGQKIRILYADRPQAGTLRVQWDGRDHHYQVLPGGVYLYRLSIGEQQVTKKMLLLK